jgi:two-component system OmpR family sensor kinase
MGRLFWKFFFAFWLALLLGAVGVGTAVWLHRQASSEAATTSPRAAMLLDSAEVVLRRGGTRVMWDVLQEWEASAPRTQLFVLDAHGRDLLERPLPEGLRQAPAASIRRVVALDGQVFTLIARGRLPPGGRERPPRHEPPSPILPITMGLLASLAFSAALAWYVAKPIRHLRDALRAVSEGHLDTRVQPAMGGRSDELADLGRDFDRMAQQLQAQIAAQQRLLHDVSHELRSPLARLHAAIGLARQDPAKLEATLERIERESVRLDELVGEVLTLSRLEAGTPGAPAAAIDLMEMVASIADDAGFEAAANGRGVHFSGDGEVIATVRGELLYRAFENVIRNAAKYTAPGSVVEVRAGVDTGKFEVVVSDQGPGVAEADLEAIFEPFHRADSATPGYGLGLAIARRAVESHGGRVQARNRPEGGLAVTITVPLS